MIAPLVLAALVSPVQEPTPEAPLASARIALRTRLEADLASGLGPRIAGELHRLLEAAEQDKHYLPVERGWIAPKSAKTFLVLNPQWPVPSVAMSLESGGEAETTVLDLHEQLAREDVRLIVIPIPTRVNVEPELLAGVSLDEVRGGFAPGLTRWMLALTDAGVEVLDLLPILAEARASGGHGRSQVYLEFNNHWGPAGARVAAEALARRLREEPWFPREVEGSTRRERVALELENARELPLDGGIPAVPSELLFERVLGADGELAADRDRESPVVLLGDSFTTQFQEQGADFARQLHHELGFAADVIALPGGGNHSARAAFARRSDPTGAKRVVVWMFAANNLRKPSWPTVDLKLGKAK